MNTAVAGATSDGSAAQNIGFAIPAARIEHLLTSLLRQHLPTTPKRHGAFLGVVIEPIPAALSRALQVHGVYVASVRPGYPAVRAGIEAGDVILSIDGTPVLDLKAHLVQFGPRGEVHQPAWVDRLMSSYFVDRSR